MVIKRLLVKVDELQNEYVDCSFINNSNVIFSDNNSVGKTTFIRFILHALCYNVPSTKRVKMDNYPTEIYIENSRGIHIVRRFNLEASILFPDKTEIKYDLKSEDNRIAIQSIIFEIDKVILLRNLTGCFYIDQDKGWTLLNRGKTIGNNRFNVTDFLGSLADKDVSSLENQIEAKTAEIKKYKTLRDMTILEEQVIIQENTTENRFFDELILRKGFLLTVRNQLITDIRDLDSIVSQNDSIKLWINSSRLVIKHGVYDEFVLKDEDLADFEINNNILLAQKKLKEIELYNLNIELNQVQNQISEQNKLFNIKDVSNSIIAQVKSSINQVQVENVIEDLMQTKKLLSVERDEIVKQNNRSNNYLAKEIEEIATRLGVFDNYIAKEGDYVFMSNLKEYSGVILHKLVFTYRLAYWLTVKKFTNTTLPFIVDSPKSAEMTEENAKEMLTIMQEKIGDNQFFVSTIYNHLIQGKKKEFKLYNGFLELATVREPSDSI